jgi:IS66 Orf2 like protein
MSRRTARASARKSKVRAAVEPVLARQKGPRGLFIRTIGIARAATKIGLANLVYNIKRMVWLTAQTDLRAGFDGLAAKVQQIIGADPFSGHVFIFFRSKRSHI